MPQRPIMPHLRRGPTLRAFRMPKLYPYATCTDIDCYAYAITVFAVATPTPAPAPPTFHPCTYDLPLWCICLLPSLRALRWSWCAPWRGFLTRPAGPICKSSSALPFVASASLPSESNKYLVYPRLCCAAALPECAQNPLTTLHTKAQHPWRQYISFYCASNPPSSHAAQTRWSSTAQMLVHVPLPGAPQPPGCAARS